MPANKMTTVPFGELKVGDRFKWLHETWFKTDETLDMISGWNNAYTLNRSSIDIRYNAYFKPNDLVEVVDG